MTLSAIKTLALGAAIAALASTSAMSEPKYGPGASDTEIIIGNTQPYSGPASAYGSNGHSMKAVFDKVNAEGGINGRQVRFLTVDDAYNPARTVEQVRRLVERDEVLLITAPVGTAPNASIQRYLNQREVPHLFAASGASRWNDPENYPWTIPGVVPSYLLEGYVFARNALQDNPDAKIAVLYQNDDLGKEYLQGLKEGLGDKIGQLVAELSHEITDPTVDSQVISLKNSGADVFMNFTSPKAGAQAIRKAAEIGWKPTQYISSVGSSVPATMIPAGIENAQGVITALVQRDPNDPAVRETPEYKEFAETMAKFYPAANLNDTIVINGYNAAQITVHVLQQAGDDLTRENILKVAKNIDTTLPMAYPGIRYKNSPENPAILNQIQLGRLNGELYQPFGDLIARD